MTENAPEASPNKQHEQDLARVHVQLGVTDLTRKVTSAMSSFFGDSKGPGIYASSNFEHKELNELIGLVENTNPADLENAGTALWNARDALKDAARELQSYVDKVDWQGESGEEFRSFGRELAKHARDLATFADVAGTQITVAGTGLASVKMPPRDDRAVKRKPETIPPEERAANKAEYDKAVQVEKDRQEAINQMYKLASYYAVSEQSLAAAEPPKFNRTLKADVPAPSASYRPPQGEASSGAVPVERSARAFAPESVVASHGTDGSARNESIGTVAPTPQPSTSVKIDSVTLQPPPTTTPPAPTPVPSPTGPAPTPTAPVPPVTGLPPVREAASRALGKPGAPRTTGPSGSPPVGRADTSRTSPATGRPGGQGGQPPMGRAGATGPVTTGTGPVAGRTSGASPLAGRADAGRSTGTSRAGRVDGIFGGKPQRHTGQTSGPRVPQGKVIGSDATTAGHTSGSRVGQRGVIGANPAETDSRPGARVTAGSNGVVGMPRASVTGSRPGAGGFTQGGSGFVNGSKGRDTPENEEQERADSSRPDYLTEEKETWEARRRNAVPPVID
ncbi:hypothetical protein QWM81_26000 [Streptomyces ficellus]|uniref:Translation initiation factor IF-2 n=1 Tax=Streptomyces ficellus TaxID=1977088 RepID=A0ABT7ZDV1_9ACTN|nr:hypothetical protein [Streptomyces ficellus]MDN3297432.1 hypothetical protein [Streptomyces ficellus]